MRDWRFARLDESAAEEIRELSRGVFSGEPWNDDWSDEAQLRAYIHDLTGQENSLTFGLFLGEELVGLSMGRVKHWYEGTEYCVDELCIRAQDQGQGLGRLFVGEIEKACREMGIGYIFLFTGDDVPAYGFYQRLGFYELEHNAAFVRRL